jgi:hypothetical protein
VVFEDPTTPCSKPNTVTYRYHQSDPWFHHLVALHPWISVPSGTDININILTLSHRPGPLPSLVSQTSRNLLPRICVSRNKQPLDSWASPCAVRATAAQILNECDLSLDVFRFLHPIPNEPIPCQFLACRPILVRSVTWIYCNCQQQSNGTNSKLDVQRRYRTLASYKSIHLSTSQRSSGLSESSENK